MGEWLSGYVVIRASGEGLAGFVNLASRAGVQLYRARRVGRHVLVATVAARDFRRLRAPARQSGVRVRLIRRGGLPFVAARIAARPGLIAGFAVAAVLVAALSARVWVVDVQGVSGRLLEQLQEVLSRSGLRPGVLKHRVETRQLEQELLEAMPQLAWTRVQIVGSVARVEVRPRRDEQRLFMAPGDVVAAMDGLVVQVIPGAGWPVVRRGDVVRRGQVLITGQPPAGVDPASARPVRATGVVYARVWSEAIAEQPLEMRIDTPTGRRATGWLVRVGPWHLRLGAIDPPFRRFQSEIAHHRLPRPLDWVPVAWDRVAHDEMRSHAVALDRQQARRIAQELALERALAGLGASPEILRQTVTTQEEERSRGVVVVRSRAIVEAVQQIGQFVPSEGR
ncbi:MAG: sporulation protein YqfD [Limnochordaceae bacterium]|nr:sporulation protein YqfD [Limnochordaceae bacterium]